MTLSPLIDHYLAYKRALGHRLQSEEAILRAFCRHLGDLPPSNVTADHVLAFVIGQHTSSATAARKQRALAGFSRYLVVRQPRIRIPIPPAPSERSEFVPYIYTRNELKRLLDAAAKTCSSRAFIEEYVMRALLLTLYGAGLRIGEALALDRADVDLDEAIITVRETKFFKTRLVPIGRDLLGVLRGYRCRHERRHPPHGDQTPFFCFRNGKRVSKSALEITFRRLRSVAGIRRDGGSRRQPRLHDLRHTAAVHRVIQWYRRGADVQRILPNLGVDLGHVDVSSTQRYLTLTPQLLREASRRFEQYVLGKAP